MFGSIYVGLSGLTAYSQGLQQVSQNVTNLNSSGFKGATVSFSDLFGGGGGAGLAHTGGGGGGGHGVNIVEKQTDFRQGELRQSERDLDLAVDGTGFLVLTRGEETFYARTGSFEIDKSGFIVLSGTDYRLATLDETGRATTLSLDAARTNAPKATSVIKLSENLSSTAATFSLPDVKVYDASGREHVWKVQFAKKAGGTADEWSVSVTDGTGKAIGTETLRFAQGLVDPATSKLVFANADAGLSVTLDLTGNVTSFSAGSVSTLRTASTDGYKVGAIATVKVNDKGRLEIGYTNEQKKDLGSVAMADFRNPQALAQRSGGLFTADATAQRELIASGDERIGRVVSRRLEASNVDLARQFGDLILIQRGFQASSQIISVSNDMIQQLFGIRGQG